MHPTPHHIMRYLPSLLYRFGGSLIHGDSGLGKTKLAEFLRPHVLGDDGYFIRGKFDQLSYGSANRPYSGISSAFAEYCSAVEQRGDDTRTEVVTKLQREIKAEEGRLLLEAIPSLRKIISGAECKEHGAECQQQGGCTFNQHVVHRRYSCEIDQRGEEEKRSCDIFSESGSHHFIYLIKRVVSVISSVGDPIVFLIDDIQVRVVVSLCLICRCQTQETDILRP